MVKLKQTQGSQCHLGPSVVVWQYTVTLLHIVAHDEEDVVMEQLCGYVLHAEVPILVLS